MRRVGAGEAEQPLRRDLISCVHAVRLLREELQLLQEPGSYVGEVIKVGECGVGRGRS